MRRESDVVPLDKRTPGVPTIEPLIFPKLERLYARRAKRLTTLADQQGEYFHFLSRLVGVQKRLVEHSSLSAPDAAALHALIRPGYAHAGLEQTLSDTPVWQNVYAELVRELAASLPPPARATLETALWAPATLSHQAALLLRGDYSNVDSGLAVVLWAALSVCWAQTMAHVGKEAKGGQVASCPCCGAPPVGSLVLGGDREGLRYLQCSLCETRWHRVRGVCISCEASGKLEHYTLDDLKSAIQAETCGDCKTYVKVFRLDYDPELEAVADDLGSLMLDSMVEEEGFTRLGLNPFSFPT